MTRSITVGVPEGDNSGHFRVNASVEHVKATGETSNNVQVQGRMGSHVSPKDAPPPTPVPVNGNTINTIHGPAKVHQRVDGQTLVDMPGGKLQVTLQEAQRAGLIVSEGAPKEPAPKDTPKETNDAPEDTGDVPTVDAEELQSHAAELNAIGETLDKAGIDSEEALTRSVTSLMDSDTLPEDVEGALVAAFGEDAGTIVHNAESHLAARVADAIKGAGLSVTDVDAMKGLQSALEGNPALASAYVSALRGQPQALNNLVAQFALSRSRGRR